MLVYVHCNPITHFDAFGLYDQDDIDARQAQQDEKQAQFDADYEAWKNSDMSPQERRAQTHSYSNRRKELEQSQSEINTMQAELDNNRWGNTDIPNNGAGTPLRRFDEDGNPVIGYMETSSSGWNTFYGDKATPEEVQMYFKPDAQGNLVPKTHEELNDNTMKALGNMGDQLAPVATACDVVAVGSGTIISAPALIPIAKQIAVFVFLRYAENPELYNQVIQNEIQPGPSFGGLIDEASRGYPSAALTPEARDQISDAIR